MARGDELHPVSASHEHGHDGWDHRTVAAEGEGGQSQGNGRTKRTGFADQLASVVGRN